MVVVARAPQRAARLKMVVEQAIRVGCRRVKRLVPIGHAFVTRFGGV